MLTPNRRTWAALCAAGALLVAVGSTQGQGFELLHTFGSSSPDGAFPWYEKLVLGGSTLYGMTVNGGADALGTIYTIGTDGSGFEVMHSFDHPNAANGHSPWGSLTLDGSTLYGMTKKGGAHGDGTIFKIGTDGAGFGMMHSFEHMNPSDGTFPYGSLTLDGSTLYGMTVNGGVNDNGTIFKIGTNGSGFGVLHLFSEATTNGRWPYGSLLLDGSTLHGMTPGGGEYDEGTVFMIATDGSGFTLVHSFSGAYTNGERPYGSLTTDGSALYGVTRNGGIAGKGVIFKLNKGVIPEPAAMALLALGGLGVLRRRRT